MQRFNSTDVHDSDIKKSKKALQPTFHVEVFYFLSQVDSTLFSCRVRDEANIDWPPSCCLITKLKPLMQWFLTGETSMNFQGGARAPYMEVWSLNLPINT